MTPEQFDQHEERLIHEWKDAQNLKGYKGSFEKWLIERVVALDMSITTIAETDEITRT